VELSEVEKSVVTAMVADLESNPSLVAQIESYAQMQSNPYDFTEAILKAMKVDGLKDFPHFQAIKERFFPSGGLGIEIDWGDLFGAALTAGAGYLTAKMSLSHNKDMANLKFGFDQRMFDRTLEEKAKTRLANETLAKAISDANKSTDTRNRSGYTGGGGGTTGGEDELPGWVIPAAIGAGVLVVGYVVLKK